MKPSATGALRPLAAACMTGPAKSPSGAVRASTASAATAAHSSRSLRCSVSTVVPNRPACRPMRMRAPAAPVAASTPTSAIAAAAVMPRSRITAPPVTCQDRCGTTASSPMMIPPSTPPRMTALRRRRSQDGLKPGCWNSHTRTGSGSPSGPRRVSSQESTSSPHAEMRTDCRTGNGEATTASATVSAGPAVSAATSGAARDCAAEARTAMNTAAASA